jgi:hypothetical protein
VLLFRPPEIVYKITRVNRELRIVYNSVIAIVLPTPRAYNKRASTDRKRGIAMEKRMSAFMLAVLLLFVPAQANAALGGETLHPGDRGEDVEELQEALQQGGFHSGKTDGVYGSVTASSVKAFQKYEGLTTDGVAGEATLEKLS